MLLSDNSVIFDTMSSYSSSIISNTIRSYLDEEWELGYQPIMYLVSIRLRVMGKVSTSRIWRRIDCGESGVYLPLNLLLLTNLAVTLDQLWLPCRL